VVAVSVSVLLPALNVLAIDAGPIVTSRESPPRMAEYRIVTTCMLGTECNSRVFGTTFTTALWLKGSVLE